MVLAKITLLRRMESFMFGGCDGNGSGLGRRLRVVETGLDFGMEKQILRGLFKGFYTSLLSKRLVESWPRRGQQHATKLKEAKLKEAKLKDLRNRRITNETFKK